MSDDLSALQEKPLGMVATVYSGGTPSRSVQSYWGGSIPWVSTAEIGESAIVSTAESITADGLRNSAAKIAPAGTLLMAMYGQGKTRGKTSILGVPAAMNQACAAIEPGPDIDTAYLLFYLQAGYEAIRNLSNSGGQENLSGDIIKKILVRYPGLPEQRRVAHALTDVSDLAERLKGLIAKKRDIKQGMMQELLSGRTRLPGFAAEWQTIRLGDHVTYVKSVALSRAQLDSDSPLKYLHYGDIHTRSTAFLDATTEDMPRAPEALVGRAGRLNLGDLVLADASEDSDGVGKSVEIVSVPKYGMIPGLHTITARFDKAVLADGFKAYLQNIPAFRSQLLSLAAGTKVLATTRRYVSSVVLPLPGTDEQAAIAQVLGDTDAEIQALEHHLESARAIKQGMMQELLTGRNRLPVEEAAA